MPVIQQIDNVDIPELSPYYKLTEAQLRNRLEPSQGIFIAESPKVIQVALDAGYTPISLLTEPRHIDGDARQIIAQCSNIPVYTGAHEVLQRITGYELTRGVLCAMRRPDERDAATICHNAKRIAILDNVVNATNTGAIFRAAAALGIDAVLLTRTCSDPLNRRAVRVSMGTVFQLPWAYLPEPLANYAPTLRKQGIATAALALSSHATTISNPVLKQQPKLAIVLGTEGDGLGADTIAACDYVVKIPMYHNVDSLNVAAAAAVAFWELRLATDTAHPDTDR